MNRLAHTLTLLAMSALSAAAIGCAGDPVIDGGEVDVSLEVQVDRADWQDAAPGCEDIDPAGMTLAACEGEPLLGALIDGAGDVACVDALNVLLVETGAIRAAHPASADPSPQPSHPGMEDMSDSGDDSVGSSSALLQLPPTTGGTRDDPTPTPIVEPLRADPTPTPVVQPEERDDPTPTPIMRD